MDTVKSQLLVQGGCKQSPTNHPEGVRLMDFRSSIGVVSRGLLATPLYDKSTPHGTVTPATTPDHDIEQYWLSFKQSMVNFYSAKHVMSRPIEQWSAKLNKLQIQKRYTEIESHIKNYLSLYGLDVLRTESQYYINILITNLKRWDKIAKAHKFFVAGDDGKNLVIILLEIAYALQKKNKSIQGLFVDVELYLLYEDFSMLIEYAVDNNTAGLIDKLMAYDPMNILHKVNDIYGTFIEYKVASLLSGKKIIKIINDHIHPGSVSP